jgi:putative phage-type endonuclease
MASKIIGIFSRALKAPQKSAEWLQARYSILTSSEVASALDCNSHEPSIELLKRKCSPFSANDLVTNSSVKWGEKYEPVAKQVFESITNTKTTDVGLVAHTTIPWLGASPDGLVSDGRMLEIKCPYHRRLIKGMVPYYYWIQVQVQLEVCDLEESYFFQCSFEDKPMNFTGAPESGVEHTGTHRDGSKWFLKNYTLDIIKRDRKWFKNSLSMLQQFWNKVEHYRLHGLGKLMADVGNKQLYFNLDKQQIEVMNRSPKGTELLTAIASVPDMNLTTLEDKTATDTLESPIIIPEVPDTDPREDNMQVIDLEAKAIELLSDARAKAVEPTGDTEAQSLTQEHKSHEKPDEESDDETVDMKHPAADIIAPIFTPIAESALVPDRNWHEWVSATDIRNYLLKDTLLDWLNLYGKSSTPATRLKTGNPIYDAKLLEYEEDFKDNSPFMHYLQAAGIEFEDAVIAYIYRQYPGEVITIANQYQARQKDKVEETIAMMKKGKPFIYHGVLHNESNKTYGICDLLVRSDCINKLFDTPVMTEDQASKPSRFSKAWHYVIIDIKHSTLMLRADGTHLLNSGSIPAFKGQVYIYNEALSIIQKYRPTAAYIIGRRWTYTTKGERYDGNAWFGRAGIIDFNGADLDVPRQASDALEWVRKVRTEGKSWSVNPPTNKYLYPNMCNDMDMPWHSFKKTLASNIGEITSLWQCGPNNRDIAHDNGIKSWHDDRCTAQLVGIKGPKQGPILDAILDVNRSGNPAKILPTMLSSELLLSKKVEFFLDFETVNDVVEKIDSFKPYTDSMNFIYMIGLGWTINDSKTHSPVWNYRCLTTNLLDSENEKEIFLTMHDAIIEILETNGALESRDYVIYHWSDAERTIYNRAADKYAEDVEQYSEYFTPNWLDLCAFFKQECIVVKGALDFSLKSIAPAMFKHGMITTCWAEDGILDGLNAMIKAIECSADAKRKGISMTELPVVKKIIEYNEVDCKVMMEILEYLRKTLIGTRHSSKEVVKARLMGKRKQLAEAEGRPTKRVVEKKSVQKASEKASSKAGQKAISKTTGKRKTTAKAVTKAPTKATSKATSKATPKATPKTTSKAPTKATSKAPTKATSKAPTKATSKANVSITEDDLFDNGNDTEEPPKKRLRRIIIDDSDDEMTE